MVTKAILALAYNPGNLLLFKEADWTRAKRDEDETQLIWIMPPSALRRSRPPVAEEQLEITSNETTIEFLRETYRFLTWNHPQIGHIRIIAADIHMPRIIRDLQHTFLWPGFEFTCISISTTRSLWRAINQKREWLLRLIPFKLYERLAKARDYIPI